jgi:hypothetical protein
LKERPSIATKAGKDPRNSSQQVGVSDYLPLSASVAQDGLTASVQQLYALDNLLVAELCQRVEIKNDGATAEAADETNATHEAAYPKLAMRELFDPCPGIFCAHEFSPRLRFAGPDAKINQVVLLKVHSIDIRRDRRSLHWATLRSR